jgi:SAM-dependent methyltransferase
MTSGMATPDGGMRVFNDYSIRSKVYDVEYTDVYDLPFWATLAEGVDTILELPSGSGRRALHLAALGKKVTTVDLEPSMIALVRRKLVTTSPRPAVRPLVADMRALDLAGTFDAVFVIREGFQFIIDDYEAIQTLRGFSRSLEDDGFIAIDLADFSASVGASPYALGYYDKVTPDQVWIDEWRRPTDDLGSVCTRRRRQCHRPDGTVTIDFQYSLREANAAPREWQASVRYRRYDRDSFLRLVARSRLQCVTLFGNYEFKRYEVGDPRMIFILKK